MRVGQEIQAVSRQAELKRLNVVAGILRDDDGKVLITERLEQGPFQGMWEFPGGKIGDGEHAEVALIRELSEEIGVEARSLKHFMHLRHDYPDRRVAIQFFLVEQWVNQPAGLEGQRIRWVAPEALAEENLLPADKPVIQALVQPDGVT